ncbi:MAG TPA: hypothetical protein VFU13_07355 [Steroidobacteraceae bacterium]|nr:hypothetical protein [Steroidobacteraceae bacterium]
MKIRRKKNLVAAAGAVALVAAASPAMAVVLASTNNLANFTFTTGTPTLLATAGFFLNANESFVVTFSAECAVDAAAGSTSAWTDIDIQLLNAAGAVVSTLSPTSGSADAFCTSNGTVGFDGWTTASMTLSSSVAPAGVYSIRVLGRLNFGTGGWFGERSLVVYR